MLLNRLQIMQGFDIIEYDYLLNNPPSPLSSYDEEKIIIMFNNAIVHSKVSNVRPMTWWYGLIKCFNDKVLEKAQYPYCIEDMKKDSLDNNIIIDDNTVLEYIRNNTQLVQEFKYINNKQSWEYYCYISLDSTKLTGGYTVPPHHIGKKYICSPKFMLSPESYEFLNKNEDDTINIKDYIIGSKEGINNLKETYSTCHQTCARLDVILDKINSIL